MYFRKGHMLCGLQAKPSLCNRIQIITLLEPEDDPIPTQIASTLVLHPALLIQNLDRDDRVLR